MWWKEYLAISSARKCLNQPCDDDDFVGFPIRVEITSPPQAYTNEEKMLKTRWEKKRESSGWKYSKFQRSKHWILIHRPLSVAGKSKLVTQQILFFFGNPEMLQCNFHLHRLNLGWMIIMNLFLVNMREKRFGKYNFMAFVNFGNNKFKRKKNNNL